jgi:fumarylacetoacetase
MSALNETHGPALRSWVASANDGGTDFPLQNLPFGRFRLHDAEAWRVGVAIGDQVLDLRAAGLVDHADMAQLLALSAPERSALRLALSRGLRAGSAQQASWQAALHAQAAVQLGLPCAVGDYTDFYIGIHHATAVGKLFRPDAPLLPNYKWVPIGYHGRSSTLIPSGQAFRRPRSQVKAPHASAPVLQPSARLDFELELGIVLGPGNALGEPIAMERAEDHVFGLTLFNDWSARDVQAWEYQPLGPFVSKNFASTVSPWIVTLEALAPFRRPFTRPEGDPQPLPYLESAANTRAGAFDIELEVWLQTQAMRAAGQPGERISRSNFADAAYWTPAQLVAHHTVGGCALRPGDLFGSGTLSGPRPEQAGSLLELSQGGQQPLTLANGEMRTFLQDGDTVTFKAWAERAGAARIGLGECSGRVLPAV